MPLNPILRLPRFEHLNVLVYISELSAIQNDPCDRNFGFCKRLAGLDSEVENCLGIGS